MSTERSSERGDGNSAERVLRLLWRRTLGAPRGSRGPRQKVSIDQIVEAGIALADAEGLAAVSVRKVAQQVGLSPMSLYTYVPDREALLGLMIDETVGRTPLPAWTGGVGERLRELSDLLWDEYHRHPWLLEVESSRPLIGPGVSARYEGQLQAIEDSGLDDISMDHTIGVIETHAAAAARRHLDQLRTIRESGQSDLEWWETNAPLLERVMPPGEYPISNRVGTVVGTTYQAITSLEAAYEFGRDVIIEGIEARIAKA